MDTSAIVILLKARLGISSTVRDAYLLKIVESIIKELEDEKGLALDETNASHLMFIVDYSTWRYQSRDSSGEIPRHLQYRLHNLIIHNPVLEVEEDV